VGMERNLHVMLHGIRQAILPRLRALLVVPACEITSFPNDVYSRPKNLVEETIEEITNMDSFCVQCSIP
jgi:hypothetical protein